MHETTPSTNTVRHSSRVTLIGISALAALYFASAFLGIPQRGRDLLVAANPDHDNHAASPEVHSHMDDSTHANDSDSHAEEHTSDHTELTHPGTPPPAWAVTPFVLLLGAIAVLPLIPSLAHWWEKNSSKL